MALLVLVCLSASCVRFGMEPQVDDGEKADAKVAPLSWSELSWGVPLLVEELNSIKRDRSLSISPDGLTLYMSSNRQGGAEGFEIWLARRQSLHASFNAPTLLEELNSPERETGASVSSDGKTIYTASDQKTGSMDLLVSTRTGQDVPFSAPAPLSALNTEMGEMWPNLGRDGLELFFVSNRPAQHDSWNVWVATRASPADPFGPPHEVGELNSDTDDWEAYLSADGLALFLASDRQGGQGKADLYISTRSAPGQPFGAPVILPPLNSPQDEADPVISDDGREFFFSSKRPEGQGEYDIWKVEVIRP